MLRLRPGAVECGTIVPSAAANLSGLLTGHAKLREYLASVREDLMGRDQKTVPANNLVTLLKIQDLLDQKFSLEVCEDSSNLWQAWSTGRFLGLEYNQTQQLHLGPFGFTPSDALEGILFNTLWKHFQAGDDPQWAAKSFVVDVT